MHSWAKYRFSEAEVFSRGSGDLDSPGLWKKPDKWETTRVRYQRANSMCWRLQDILQGQTSTATKRCKMKNRGTFATNGQSRRRQATESETNAVCPVIEWDTDVKQLPYQVSPGLVLESLGTLYNGPYEDKYWSEIRCGHRHPYPVGYKATKTYKGVKFKQSIEEGPNGPLFVVGEVGKASHSADSPAKAWSLALFNSQSNGIKRIHGRKHFGFDCPLVLGLLSDMEKEAVNCGVQDIVDTSNLNKERDDMERQKLGLDDKGDTVSCILGDNGYVPQAHRNPVLRQKVANHISFSGEVKRLTQKSTPHHVAFGGLIRLRSVLLEDTLNQKVQTMSCLEQISTFPGTRQYFEEGAVKLDNLENSLVTRAFSTGQSPFSELITIEQITAGPTTVSNSGGSSMDSIMSNINAESLADDRGVDLETGRSTSEGLENTMTGSTSRGKLFSSPVHRSRITLDSSVSKDSNRRGIVPTRSLANLIEGLNKSEISPNFLNGRIRSGSGEGNRRPKLQDLSKVEGLPSAGEDESLTGIKLEGALLDMTDEDIQRRVKEWVSGAEGRSTILKEIQQLVLDHHVDEALGLLRKLHSKGINLDDPVYSVFFPFEFDEWQKQTVEEVKEKSVLLCAPGGAGKFVVAARCLYEALVQGERCLLVTPYEALAKDHVQQFQVLFGSKNVGSLSQGDEGWSQFAITIVTLETLIKVLREGRSAEGSQSKDPFSGFRLAVMDRFHTLGDASFGSLWEEAIMLLDHQVKVLALSLPMMTPHDVVSWISCTHGPCSMVSCASQPVPKSYYYCDTSGLHLLAKSDQENLPSTSCQSENPLTVNSDSWTNLKLSIRVLLCSRQTEAFLPLAVSFSSIDDCVAMMDTSEVIQDRYLSAEEAACVEERLQIFFRKNPNLAHAVKTDDIDCLVRGFTMYQDGQAPLWLEFIQGLIRDDLVKVVFTTNATMSKTRLSFRTMALFAEAEIGKSSQLNSELVSLYGKAGRRGLDIYGNVVFLGSKHIWQKNATVADSSCTISIQSHFKPCYSLLLNLLRKHTLPEVRKLIGSNYADYGARELFEQELKELERKILEAEDRKRDLESKLFQKLSKINTAKLQDAKTFTQVDVRIGSSGHLWASGVLPGLLFAVLPGPSELLYVILCADNNFRLLPAGSLEHVYTEEQGLDAVYRKLTGNILSAPPLPSKGNWKISPGEPLACYTAEGNSESARIVEVLVQHGFKFPMTGEELSSREEISSCSEMLSTLHQQQELLLSSRQAAAVTAWTNSEKLIKILEKADALELITSKTTCAKLKPLGVLISRFHHVENELWCCLALSSGIVKPLTAPELAAICSALVFTDLQVGPGSCRLESRSLSKAPIAHVAPKRLQAALEKLENLHQKVALLQESDDPPMQLDGSHVAMVHLLGRETVWQDPLSNSNRDRVWIIPLVQQTIKLLRLVDDVWGRSSDVLSELGGTSGLHNVARRAAHLLQKVIVSGR